jgi:hypothetical protein
MAYNDKYFFEFDTLKTADKTQLFYKVLFSKKEDSAVVYDLVELTPANSPFVLSYKSLDDFAFSPFRVSSAEINILYPYDPVTNTPQPENFFSDTDEQTWRVQLLESTDNGATFNLKWQGFLINDIQYEWQDAYYYRLTATDNLGVLKDIKYSRSDRFAMPNYDPETGQSLLGFIYESLEFTGNVLDLKIACNLKVQDVIVIFEEIYTSKYAYIDWDKKTPVPMYDVLTKLMRSLGCILYLDNSDCSWTVLNINEIATSPNNEVPYRKYNEGGFFEDGVLNFNSTINYDTSAFWRDKNQLVSIMKPINTVRFFFPYKPKNLLSNYGFQYDLATPSPWTENFLSGNNEVRSDIPTGRFANRIFPKNYDDYYFHVESNELNGAGITGDRFLGNQFDGGTSLFSYQKFLHAKFDFQIDSLAESNEGFNFQLYATRVSDEIYFDNSDPAVPFGTWSIASSSTNPAPRIPVFGNGGKSANFQIITSGIVSIMQSIGIKFLPFRYNTTEKFYNVDNIQLNVLAQKHKDLVKTGYFASNSNNQINELEFDDMMFIGGEDVIDNHVFEDFICVQDGSIPANLTVTNQWNRAWETGNENTYKNFNELALLSIVSFYRQTARKFSGNVYSDNFDFLQYYAIQGATLNNGVAVLYEEFELIVLEDDGTVEETSCGADFLSEFYAPLGNFLTIEKVIDYSNSTTLVNLHEDFTNILEPNFYSGIGGSVTQPGGIFGTFTGGATISPQQTLT